MSDDNRPGSAGPAPFRLEMALAGLEKTPAGDTAPDLAKAREDGEAFLRKYPTWKALDAGVRKRGETRVPPAGKLLPFRPRPWLALAAILALCLIPVRLMLPGKAAEGPELTPKGAGRFSLLVGGRPADPTRETPVRSGDTAQLFLHNDGPLHYAVFFRDDGGPWELYFASAGEAAASPLGAPLRNSIVLGTGWRYEEIAAVAGSQAPGAVARDCLPASLPGATANFPAHCRDLTVQFFRLRLLP